jgi:Tol biopolymer transport system component
MRVYFLAREHAVAARYSIVAWSMMSGRVHRISSPEIDTSNIGPLTVSWDGRQLAFQGDGRLVITKADGSGRRDLAMPKQLDPITSVSWSPDGAVIAIDGGWLVPVDGSPPRRIIPEPLPGSKAWLRHPSFGPDGRILFSRAFWAPRPGCGVCLDSTNLYVVDADGANLRRIYHTYDLAHATWSPRGDWIAFDREHRVPQRAGIYVIRPDGTGEKFLYGWGSWNPAWSPDGRYLSFQCSTELLGEPPPASEQVCVGDVSGGAPKKVTNDGLDKWISVWGWAR